MTTNEPAPVSRWLKAIGLLVLATAVLAVAGCGGDSDTPAVCDSLETLSSNVDGLKDISLEDGETAVTARSAERISISNASALPRRITAPSAIASRDAWSGRTASKRSLMPLVASAVGA